MCAQKRVVFNWSGGKDSAFALYRLLQSGDTQVETLLTSVHAEFNRISMHGVRVGLLQKQARALQLPLQLVPVPAEVSMQDYDALMRTTLSGFRSAGITEVVFGDIFLEDLRQYREARLAEVDMRASFPLWKKDTHQLAHDFIAAGFKTIIVCVDASALDSSFAGRVFDHDFLRDLPSTVDPCGEHGEFHTFVYDGPIFERPVQFEKGEIIRREYNSSPGWRNAFWYCDLVDVP